MEHLRRSFNFTCTHLGPHGLPLIGRADWNDCLNLNCFSEHPGESFQITGPASPVAESVFIAGMFVKYGHEYAQLCDHLNLTEEAAAARKHIDAVEQATLTAGWDGAWFRRAYDAFGKPIGSKECTEVRSLLSRRYVCHGRHRQGERTGRAALASVEERLDTKYGVVLLQPAYTSYQLNLARSPAILRDTRRTPVSSATTTRGSAAPRQRLATVTAPLRCTARPAPPTSRTFPISTAPSPTFTVRW